MPFLLYLIAVAQLDEYAFTLSNGTVEHPGLSQLHALIDDPDTILRVFGHTIACLDHPYDPSCLTDVIIAAYWYASFGNW